jgi:hypothetical protein
MFRDAVQVIQKLLSEVVTSDRANTEIHIWLDSPGGDAHAAYKLWLALRAKCGRLVCAIPDFAKSAATLLAVGCDEIVMSDSSELGPLDVQVTHPDRDNVSVSGLDMAGAIGFVGEVAIECLATATKRLVEVVRIPRRDALKEAAAFSSQLFQPLIAKLDPQLIHKATNDLDVARRYATTMLCQASTSRAIPLSVRQAKEISKVLVANYPSHGFVIGAQDALRFGLPVTSSATYPHWEHATACLALFEGGALCSREKSSFIDLWTKKEIADKIKKLTPPLP